MVENFKSYCLKLVSGLADLLLTLAPKQEMKSQCGNLSAKGPNVTVTLINPPPPRTCFAIRAYGRGGFSIINDGGGGRTR